MPPARSKAKLPIKLADCLPQPAYRAGQVKDNEAEVAASQGIEMYALMESAGGAVFSLMQSLWPKATKVLVLCGKGNNGGDGFICARLLRCSGIDVQVLSTVAKNALKGDALTAYLQLEKSGAEVLQAGELALANYIKQDSGGQIIVDSLFGIGFHGQLSQDSEALVRAVNSHGAKVISVDLPSGLNADSGTVNPEAVKADVTLTFIAVKQGLLTGQAAGYVGCLYLADLGLGQAFREQIGSDHFIQGRQQLPVLEPVSAIRHKSSPGLVLAIGGNQMMPGAIRLAGEAALRCGASMLAVACHQENRNRVFNGLPEMMLAPDRAGELACSAVFNKAKVMILGPGLGRDHWAKHLFDFAITQQLACVIDADGLYLLRQAWQQGGLPDAGATRVLTPHSAEAACLLGCKISEINRDRFAAVKAIARQYQGVCLLKGPGTLISDGKTVWINTCGNPGMATGGMGDVLSGIIAAMLLQLSEPLAAVRLAAYLHGQAGDNIVAKQGQRGLLASDLFPELLYLVNHYQVDGGAER
ncbi:NAD(P)H-hydrate dehydratase [Thalassomonas actiniarum]|uniref:Bifunctional NAD(P)H-hydrate repair enzyme n=1 Tax=Thalassomonas actiniarum TaxID=485447 RepID=A0AAF0C1Z1_9GAMM|nr:NAD(P)H-hydrate dehydratase [Thalassomonas actiniarum]WDD99516.1 NAD(P)H-hydrate dehydratase [Thalassomonas actiniarum]